MVCDAKLDQCGEKLKRNCVNPVGQYKHNCPYHTVSKFKYGLIKLERNRVRCCCANEKFRQSQRRPTPGTDDDRTLSDEARKSHRSVSYLPMRAKMWKLKIPIDDG